jgi:hypothetical protein
VLLLFIWSTLHWHQQETFLSLISQEKFYPSVFLYDNGPDYFLNDLSRFVESHQIGFINKKGEKVIPAQFDAAFPFCYNKPIAVVGKNKQKETIDAHGCNSFEAYLRLPFADLQTDPPGHEGANIYKTGQWGAIDAQGKIIVPIIYDKFEKHIGESSPGTLIFYKDGQAYKLYYEARQGQFKLKE